MTDSDKRNAPAKAGAEADNPGDGAVQAPARAEAAAAGQKRSKSDRHGDAPASDDDSDAPASGRDDGGDGGGSNVPGEPPSDGTAATPSTSSETPPRPWHPARGGLIAALGAVVPFLIMASDGRWTFSVPLGLLGCLVATWGVLDLLGSFDDPRAQLAGRATLKSLSPRLVELAGSVVVLVVLLKLAVAGVLPWPVASAALLIPTAFLWCVVSAYRVAEQLGAYADRPLLRRHGFWLVVLITLLYLPMLGSYSLSDPWETHYGEVAREMLARDDWISLWWAQDGWFWSKPILDFWIQGLFFSLLGVRFMPDQMLAGVAEGHFPQPEWAARMPVFLLTLVAMYLAYKAVAKVWGRRAGLLSGIVLATMPYWYLIAHQTMTDMPYVAPLVACMALLLLGFHTDPEARVGVFELAVGKRTLRFTAAHLLLAAVVLLVLPQVLYLLSRNVTLQVVAEPHGFLPHEDWFWSGSGGGNCGLPGNQGCDKHLPSNRSFQPWMAALVWGAVAGMLLWAKRGERRLGRLYFLAAWVFLALSAMAKGAPGLVLPIFATGIYVGATRRWKDLGRLELPSMLLLIACVALPWYVQMYMRHGQPFTDRLLFHDMYKRAFVHVHDTNTGDDTSFRYYIWQLGYGLFPWTGLAAGGLLWWLRRGDAVSDRKSDGAALLALWFVSAFSMFTISLTKFHHYILPAVPPMALLLGVMLDRAFDAAPLPTGKRLGAYLTGLGASALLIVYGFFRFFPGALSGSLVDGAPPAPMPVVGGLSLALGVALAVVAARRWGLKASPRPALASVGVSDTAPAAAPVDPSADYRSPAKEAAAGGTEQSAPRLGYDSLMLGAIGLASAVVVALAGRDLFTTRKGDIVGQARIMHLFTYNYRRAWPEALDYNAVLIAFTLAASVLCALLVVHRWRGHIVVLLLSVGVWWTAWGIDVYLVNTSPHWGQRETIMAYYQDRKSADQPIVAYQMNWKGENFYSGNRIPAFVSSGAKFKNWVSEQKQQGVKVMYFTTEHGRIGSLKRELGDVKKFDVLTDEALNNKFMLARVVL